MTRLRSTLAALSFAAGAALLPNALGAQAPAAVDLTGKWQLTVVSDAGTVESKDALKGTAKFGDVASGTFTAKRL